MATPIPYPVEDRELERTFNNLHKEHWTLGTKILTPCPQESKFRTLFQKVQEDSSRDKVIKTQTKITNRVERSVTCGGWWGLPAVLS